MELTYKLHFYVFLNIFRTLSSSILICTGLVCQQFQSFALRGWLLFQLVQSFSFFFFLLFLSGKSYRFYCPLALVCPHLYLLRESLMNFLMYPYQHKILKTFLEYKVTFIVQKVAFIYIMSYWCIFIIFHVIFNSFIFGRKNVSSRDSGSFFLSRLWIY